MCCKTRTFNERRFRETNPSEFLSEERVYPSLLGQGKLVFWLVVVLWKDSSLYYFVLFNIYVDIESRYLKQAARIKEVKNKDQSQKLVGRLNYLSHTDSNIVFAVSLAWTNSF